MDIKLYRYRTLLGLPNPSPFCMKLEIYMRLAGFPYTSIEVKGRPRSTTGKAPYVEIDGKVITDSGLIIEHLERHHGNRLDGRLTLAQRAEARAFQQLLEEHLYWVLVYGRWLDPEQRENSDTYIQQLLGLPSLLFPLLSRLIRADIRKSLHGQGIGRHAPEIIWQMGIADVAALGHWLGAREYAFADKPTTLDLCMASFIGNIVRQPWSNPLTAATLKYGNLVAHFERVLGLTFPELMSTAP